MVPTARALADAWVAYCAKDTSTGEYVHTGEHDPLDQLVDNDPELAWDVILAILDSIEPKPESHLFQILAAGPLEDLLSSHGAALIERVEVQARRAPAFNLLLGGVWRGGMSQAVWERVERCRLTVW